ncbi:MAG: hypothetical protein HY051_00790 [Candidatus Aenigmarchaeota archaeon]|nr:hypothetical protein [Candidatus Aenigmarchaeota archaeon]
MANVNPTAQGGRIARQGLLGQLYEHTLGWAGGHKLASSAMAVTLAGAITVGTLLSSGGSAREAVNANTDSRPAVVQTASSQSQTASEIYYSQVRASLLQDVPELANYQSALDYTAQRMVDMRNVYGLSLDEVRSPVAKWVQANIDWDRKGERLVGLSEGTDLIPDAMLQGNFTANQNANDLTVAMKKRGIDNQHLAALSSYVDELIAEHDQIWNDINDPQKLEMYLDTVDGEIPLPFTAEIAVRYESAIRTSGTLRDKQSWGLLGRLLHIQRPEGSNEELRRNEQYLSSLLAVGGDGKISENVLYFESDTYPRGITRGDRQTMFRMSQQLKQAIKEFGTLLDPDYLAPNLPSVESVKAAKNYSWPTNVKNAEIVHVFVHGNPQGITSSYKRTLFLK